MTAAIPDPLMMFRHFAALLNAAADLLARLGRGNLLSVETFESAALSTSLRHPFTPPNDVQATA